MTKINKIHLIDLIKKIPEQRVLVIGDIILDKYVWCEINRISPEAPVPVALVNSETYVLGGAANVASNLAHLGAMVSLVGILGDDVNRRIVLDNLKQNHIDFSGLLTHKGRPTTVKERIMCGTHQSIRVDREDVSTIDEPYQKSILEYVKNNLFNFKVIILSDYSKGLISEYLAQSIITLANKNGIKVLSDPTPNNFRKFRNSFLIKPNKKEAEEIAGEKIADDYSNLKNISSIIANKLDAKLIITLGKDGMAIFDNEKISIIPTVAEAVYDVSGAGDTAIAAFALGLAAGGSLEDAAFIGNCCSGVVVAKVGTATCSFNELEKKIIQELKNED